MIFGRFAAKQFFCDETPDACVSAIDRARRSVSRRANLSYADPYFSVSRAKRFAMLFDSVRFGSLPVLYASGSVRFRFGSLPASAP